MARVATLSLRPIMAWAGTGGVVTAVAMITLGTLAPGPTVDLWPLALAIWCTVTLGAGIALLVASRVGGWTRPGHLGATLLALALVVTVIPRLSAILEPVAALQDLRPLGTSVVLTVAVVQVVRSLRLDEVDSAARPIRELARLLCVMVVCVLAATTVLMVVGDALLDVAGFAPGAICVVGAGACLQAVRPAPRVLALAFAVALALMGAGSLLHHIAFGHIAFGHIAFGHIAFGDVSQAVAAGCMAAGAWVFAGIARGRLVAAFAMHDARSLQTLVAIGRYSSEASRDRERRHDALNALAAITSATEVLTSHSDRLDPLTREDLARAAREELLRVERLLAPPSELLATEVSLADVLRPVLLARISRGLWVQGDLGSTRVTAAPDAVARIVGNLLQNVERHAPGSCVRLSVDEVGAAVHLNVIDNGPGIPAEHCSRVFDRGFSSHAAGQGLGLPSARRLAREQGGDLSLVSGGKGCWFVLTLPGSQPCAASTSVRAQVG